MFAARSRWLLTETALLLMVENHAFVRWIVAWSTAKSSTNQDDRPHPRGTIQEAALFVLETDHGLWIGKGHRVRVEMGIEAWLDAIVVATAQRGEMHGSLMEAFRLGSVLTAWTNLSHGLNRRARLRVASSLPRLSFFV